MKNKKLNKVNQVTQVDARFTHGETIRADLRRSKLWKAVLSCVMFIILAASSVLGFVGLGGKSPFNDSSIDSSNEVAYAEDMTIYYNTNTVDTTYPAKTVQYTETPLAAAWRTAVNNSGTFTLTSDWIATPKAGDESSVLRDFKYNTTNCSNYFDATFRTEFGRDWEEVDLDGDSTTLEKRFVQVTNSDQANAYNAAFYNSYTMNSNNDKYGVASNQSGALFVPKGKKVTINLNGHKIDRNLTTSPVTFDDDTCAITEGGLGKSMAQGYVIRVEGELTITGMGAITGGWSTSNASAIYVTNGGKLTIEGEVDFSGNYSDSTSNANIGSPIYVDGGSANYSSVTIDGSKTTDGLNITGSCRYDKGENGSYTAKASVTPKYNYKDMSGTLHYWPDTAANNYYLNTCLVQTSSYVNLNLTKCNITDNYGTYGAINAGSYCNLVLKDVKFTNNYGSTSSGLYMGDYGTLSLSNVTISGNSGGNPIFVQDYNTVTISNCEIKDSSVGNGAIYCRNYNDVRLDEVDITGNTGTGIYLSSLNTLKLTNCSIVNNNGTYGVYAGVCGDVTIDTVNITNNYGSNTGGMSLCCGKVDGDATVSLTNVKINYNTSNSCGGFYVSGASNLTTTVDFGEGCEITNNTSSGGVGGVSVNSYATFNYTTGTICDNTGGSVGGISVNTNSTLNMANVDLTNCKGTTTATNNNSGYCYVGAVYVNTGSTFNLTNGKITGCYGNIGAVSVYNSSTFNFNSGEITDNETITTSFCKYYIGAVCVEKNSTFNMGTTDTEVLETAKCKISNHIGSIGAVSIRETSTFNFISGTISNNKSAYTSASAEYVGGVYLGADCTFNMGEYDTAESEDDNCLISNNSGPVGAVSIYNGIAFNFYGGTIFNNKSTVNTDAVTNVGGICVYISGISSYRYYFVMNMSGNALVSFNQGIIGGISLYRANSYGSITFNMSSGRITTNTSTVADNNYWTYSAGGIYAYSSTINMTGGEISDNVGLVGGVRCHSTPFTMDGGKIYRNRSNYSYFSSSSTYIVSVAGVYNDNTFTMNGGEISYNYAKTNDGSPMEYGNGGVVSRGTVYMNGGTIANNVGLGTKRGTGGLATFETSGNFHLYGGTITNNIGYISGGIHKPYNSSYHLYVKGAPVVKNNYYVDETLYDNVGTATKYPNDIDLYCGRLYPNYENRPAIADRNNIIDVNGILYDENTGDNADLYVVKYTDNYAQDATSCFTKGYGTYNTRYSASTYFHPSQSDLFITRDWSCNGIAEASFESYCDAQNWADAVRNSSTSASKIITLYHNWTATYSSYANIQRCFRSMYYDDTVGFSNGALYVPSGRYVELDLNGFTIDRDLQESLNNNAGYVIYNLGLLEVSDSSTSGSGKITGGYNTHANAANHTASANINITNGCGGGIYNGKNADFTLWSGNITGNVANFGAGIFNYNGTVNIYGGKITNNRAVGVTEEATELSGYGGGIFNCTYNGTSNTGNSAALSMQGGTISGNSAKRGGGVGVYSYSETYGQNNKTKLTHTAAIVDNSATISGGGIDIFLINAYFGMGGHPTVENNNVNGKDDDIHLPSTTISGTSNMDNGLITIVSPLDGDKSKKYGVYRDIGYTFTVGFKAKNPSDSPADYFEAQRDGFYVSTDADGNGQLISNHGYDNWFSAVTMSKIFGAKKYTVTLTENWTAVDNGTTNFSSSLYGNASVDTSTSTANPYYYGAMNVPDGTSIILDLNGYTIDRGLASGVGGTKYGYVIAMQGGTLSIRDNSEGGNGKISGGWVESTEAKLLGGGITLFNTASRLDIRGGSITGNKASVVSGTTPYGVGGIALQNAGAQITMLGGSIKNNVGSFAGGIAFNTLKENTFKLGGSAQVYGNTKGDRNTAFGDGEPNDVFNDKATSGTTLSEIKDTKNYKITIIQKFTDEAHICICRPDVNNVTLAETNGNVFTYSYAQYNVDASGNVIDPTKYFFPSDKNQSHIKTYAPQTGDNAGAVEVTIWNVDLEMNWSNAIAQNISATSTSPITVKLEHDWIADDKGSFGTGTGFSSNGGLLMNQSNVILDLNGYTIDRRLFSLNKKLANGCVISMTGSCRLEIIDSSAEKTGKIMGGNSSTVGQAGGIDVSNSGAYLTINGGTITCNSGYDGGVATYVESTFKTTNYFAMGGSALVTGNTDFDGSPMNINLRAKYNQYILLLSALTKGGRDGEKSGVYKESSSDFTLNFEVYHSGESPVDYFVADSGDNYVIESPTGEAALYTMDNYSNWLFAVNESIATGYERTVMLVSNWTADEGMFGKSTSDNVAFFNGGALKVPSGAKIILDLNGYTLDRNLEISDTYGFVIHVIGKLTVRDTYEGKDRYGRITGGNNTYNTTAYAYCGGGIDVNNSANLYLEGGVIEGNSSNGTAGWSTGGVFVGNSNAHVYMTGGIIRNNNGEFAGGIYVPTASSVYLGGSAQVYNNKLNTGRLVDIRPLSDSISYKIQIYSSFTSDADIGVSYKGNNYYADLTQNIFTTNFNNLNPGVDPSTVFHYSDPLAYKVISLPSANNTGLEAAVECVDNEQNWRQAVAASSSTVKKTVTLTRNWIAYDSNTYKTAFGEDASAYKAGAIYLPQNKSVILDLNGYTIDRNLTSSEARTNGLVFLVNGNLEITDSSSAQSGKITGGNSSDTAGGIKFTDGANGSLKLTGGTITGNVGTVGGVEVCWTSNAAAPLYMGGSALVTGNKDIKNQDSDLYGTSPVQMIEILSPLTAAGKTGFQRPGVGDFTVNFVKYMRSADPAEYFTSTDPMYVYKYETGEAGLYTNDNAMNWEYAIKASVAGNKKQIIFKLVSDWTAEDYRFGTDETYTAYTYNGEGQGALNVPANADIIVDLNGYTLDRGLTNALQDGYIFRVCGFLTVRDTSKEGNGIITGGFNNYNSTSDYARQSSVFCVYGGAKLNIESGTIMGNHATGAYSSVITTNANAPITITGGKITGNYGGDLTSDNGAGAIYVRQSNIVNLGGSPIILDNKHNRGYDCDIRFETTGIYVQIIDSFTSKAKIGVAPSTQVNNWTTTTGGVQFTYNYASHHVAADYPDRYFVGRWMQKHSVTRITTASGAEGAFWCTENYTNWVNAVAASSMTNPIKFELSEDWVANAHNTYTTAFHPTITSTYYLNGAINLPANKSIVLDLKGYKIDRNLVNGVDNGYIINVLGRLEIIDSSNKHTGLITGGFNTLDGGGIVVKSGGTLCIKGGTIAYNRSQTNGSGIYIENGGHIEIGDYAQVNNNMNDGGASSNLYIYNTAEKIKIVSDLYGKKPIGISRASNGYVTDGFSEYMYGYSPLDYFVSENPNYYGIESSDGELFFLSPDNHTNWQYAVQASQDTGKTQTVRLTNDWFASESSDYTTAFGTGVGYSYGALY
ncbi:MAG: right-handed parallel beta-helix repeat-containing protein, partial [Candidatus Coproplasma sp.]